MSAILSQQRRRIAERTLHFLDLLDLLRREARWIIGTLAAVTLAGALYAWVATPIYRSDLLIEVEEGGGGAAQGLMGALSSALEVKSSGDTEMEVLRSRMVIGAAVDRVHYDIDAEPQRLPLLGSMLARGSDTLSTPGLLGFGGYTWGNESIAVDRLSVPPAMVGKPFVVTLLEGECVRVDGPADAGSREGRIGDPISMTSSEGGITLVVRAVHARPGAKFVVRSFSRQDTIAELQRQLVIFQKGKQSSVISVTLDGARAHRIAAFLQAMGQVYLQQNSERRAVEAESSLAFLERQLPELKRQLESSEDALLQFRRKSDATDLSEQGKLMLAESVALQARISQLAQERQAQLVHNTAAHPNVVALDAQAAQLQGEMKQLRKKLDTLPANEQAVIRLTRDVRVNSELYTAMLNSIQQLRITKAGKVANVRLLDNAEPAETPVKPRRVLVLLGAALLGAVLGLCVALLRGLGRQPVTQPGHVEELLGTVVYAVIPQSKAQKRRDRFTRRAQVSEGDVHPPLAISDAQDAVVESLQNLRMGLQIRLLEARNRVVLITGATPGVGKSFVSTNLAVVLATSGLRVLLIDADLRKGTLHNSFAYPVWPDLISLLQGNSSVDEVIHASGTPGLDLLLSTRKQAATVDLKQTSSFVQCIEEVADRYDVVLIDSAPVLPVADTLALARCAGTILAVARYGDTSEGELIELQARLARVGASLDGVLINDMQYDLQGTRYGRYGMDGYGKTAAANTTPSV